MEFNSSESESTYASLQAGVSTFVMNTLATYKQMVDQLEQSVKTLTEAKIKLENELKDIEDPKEGNQEPDKPVLQDEQIAEPHPMEDK